MDIPKQLSLLGLWSVLAVLVIFEAQESSGFGYPERPYGHGRTRPFVQRSIYGTGFYGGELDNPFDDSGLEDYVQRVYPRAAQPSIFDTGLFRRPRRALYRDYVYDYAQTGRFPRQAGQGPASSSQDVNGIDGSNGQDLASLFKGDPFSVGYGGFYDQIYKKDDGVVGKVVGVFGQGPYPSWDPSAASGGPNQGPDAIADGPVGPNADDAAQRLPRNSQRPKKVYDYNLKFGRTWDPGASPYSTP